MGLDPTSSEKKASGCAVLDSDSKLLHLSAVKTDDEILGLVERHKPDIVGIDSPLGYPSGMCCLEESCECDSVHEFKGRRCEKMLSAQGISLYYTTKRTFIKKMIYRSINLKTRMEAMGSQVYHLDGGDARTVAGGKQGNTGYSAGVSAIEMVNLLRTLD